MRVGRLEAWFLFGTSEGRATAGSGTAQKQSGIDEQTLDDSGDTWDHLGMCLICGHVGCCDSSKSTHATNHFHMTEHPLARSIEPGESWVCCYADRVMAAELEA